MLGEGGFEAPCEAKALASIAYGLCKSGAPKPAAQALLHALRPAACHRLGELRATELSQLLWAYATVGGAELGALFTAAEEQIVHERTSVAERSRGCVAGSPRRANFLLATTIE